MRNVFETVMGAFVLLVALAFVVIAYRSGSVSDPSGYMLMAKFDRAGGISVGSDVRVSGLKVGSVTDTRIDPDSYLAVLRMTVDKHVRLPRDTSAEIIGDGLLGGKFIDLVPGADSEMLGPNEEIKFTQSSISLEALIGKFVFGGAGNHKDKETPKSGL